MVSPLANAVLTCTINSPPNINFGTYDPFATIALDGVGSGTIRCSTNLVSERVNLSISASAGSGAAFSPRRMNGPTGNTLAYYLYTNSLRTRIFGTGSGGSVVFNTSFTARPARTYTHTIYGRITAGQDVAVGSYSDTLIYTVNF